MGTKAHRFSFDFGSALVFAVSVALGLYIVYELVAAYIQLFY